ncbi:probable E3 ubiquitin-protein ligase MARCHF10 [Pseudophryne corroboree]|uniref:probable E3 ubiquitin-protein ligase MARCHF10 n=1 Tax=Pseudophryne corroboree TaxID=495146 RepID=UPI003081C933
MEKDWDRYKSIVNGHHMRDMQHKMASEYQSHLHQQQCVREQAECVRERQVGNQSIPHPLSTFYSSRSYSKPWQNGMTTKTQIPVETGHESGQNKEWHYSSTVSKLPAIKDKKPIRKKTASCTRIMHQPQTSITVSQPSIAVEKKRVHVRQLSARLGGTYGGETSGRGNVLQTQSKPKKPKGLFEQQRQIFQEKETTQRHHNGMSSTNHDRILTPVSATSYELRKQTQCISRPASSRIAPLQRGEDVFNGQPVRNIVDATESDGVNTADAVYEVSVSDNARQLPLIVRTPSYNIPANQPHTVETNFIDSYEDQVHDSENEEHPSSHRQIQEVNTDTLGSTLNGLDTAIRNNSSFGRPDPAPLLASHTLPQMHGLNENNINVQSQEYSTVPQTASRALVGRERAIPSSEPSVAYVPPLRLSLSSTAPTILRENLDLVFHTLSMQRQSANRNMENIVSTAQNKEPSKQTDPEKLKKLQEREVFSLSLLEEDSEEEGDLCRICLMGGETTENHLIAPCQCTGSLEYVHTECMKKWLMAKIKSGAELSVVRTCEMCKQRVECDIEGFNLDEQYRKHQQTKATLNPSLYLVLLLHLYQQRYEELLRLSNTRERVSEISRHFSHLSSGSNEDTRDNDQDF